MTGLDVLQDSIAVAHAAGGSAGPPVFVGAIGPRQADLDQLLRRLQGKTNALTLAYEAGLTAPTVVAAPQALGLRARQGAPTARGVPSVGSARSSSWPYSDRHGSGRHDDVTHAALGTPFQHARWP